MVYNTLKIEKKVLTKVKRRSIMNTVLTSSRYARVAQWWSIALPRRGSRVRIPSRASKEFN